MQSLIITADRLLAVYLSKTVMCCLAILDNVLINVTDLVLLRSRLHRLGRVYSSNTIGTRR